MPFKRFLEDRGRCRRQNGMRAGVPVACSRECLQELLMGSLSSHQHVSTVTFDRAGGN
jgi:hypothetical protein